jgi:hypothetical protein
MVEDELGPLFTRAKLAIAAGWIVGIGALWNNDKIIDWIRCMTHKVPPKPHFGVPAPGEHKMSPEEKTLRRLAEWATQSMTAEDASIVNKAVGEYILRGKERSIG